MVIVACPKCGGTGYIRAYAGIAGGVCFCCNGTGKKKYKTAPKPRVKFPISAVRRETGEMISPIFWVRGCKTAEQARAKAVKQLSGANGYIPESVIVGEPETV